MSYNKWRNIINEEAYAWLKHAVQFDPFVNRIWHNAETENGFFRELAKYKVEQAELLLSDLQTALVCKTVGPMYKLDKCIVCGKTLECPDHCVIGKAKEENEVQ